VDSQRYYTVRLDYGGLFVLLKGALVAYWSALVRVHFMFPTKIQCSINIIRSLSREGFIYKVLLYGEFLEE